MKGIAVRIVLLGVAAGSLASQETGAEHSKKASAQADLMRSISDVWDARIRIALHNIANLYTVGFKRTVGGFESLLYLNLRSPGLERDARGTASPLGAQLGTGARLATTARIYTPGVLEKTDRELDVALTGKGFFQVQTPNGTTGYTRDGRLAINADGKLVTGTGLIIQPEFTFPDDIDGVRIDPEGLISGRVASQRETITFGQIQLARFVNALGLNAVGGNVLTETDASGVAITAHPGSDGLGKVQQGFIERSNVVLADELQDLMTAKIQLALINQAYGTKAK